MSAPTMWREELYHPLTVHFPIVFLTVATFLYLGFFLTRHPFLKKTALLNLFLGVITAWISIHLGQKAEDIVNRVICDPTVTHAHKDYALYSTWIFSGTLIIMIIQKKIYLDHFFFQMIILLLLGIGSILLVYTGHLGATLVYQQGAAVYHPSERCSEFE